MVGCFGRWSLAGFCQVRVVLSVCSSGSPPSVPLFSFDLLFGDVAMAVESSIFLVSGVLAEVGATFGFSGGCAPVIFSDLSYRGAVVDRFPLRSLLRRRRPSDLIASSICGSVSLGFVGFRKGFVFPWWMLRQRFPSGLNVLLDASSLLG